MSPSLLDGLIFFCKHTYHLFASNTPGSLSGSAGYFSTESNQHSTNIVFQFAHHYRSLLVAELNKLLCWHLVITFFLLVELTNVDAPSYWTPFSHGDAWDHVSLFAYAECFRGCIHDNPHLTRHDIIPTSILNYIVGNMYTEIRAYT